MAIQAGPVPFTGKLGSLVGYRGKNGKYLLKLAPEKPLHKKKTGPRQRVTKLKTEFGRASSFAAQLRNAVGKAGKKCKDGGLCNRLNKEIYELLRDQPGALGTRIIGTINIKHLEGFQWNKDKHFSDIFLADYAGFVDPVKGRMHIIVASFNTLMELVRPHDATHFQIFAVGLYATPGHTDAASEIASTDRILVDAGHIQGLQLNVHITTAPERLLFLGLGIRFYNIARGRDKELHEGAFEIIRACRVEETTA